MPKARNSSSTSDPAQQPVKAVTPSPSPRKTCGKRKARTPDSDSEPEIVAKFTHSKKMKTAQSPPGSPAFNKLMPVTVTAKVDHSALTKKSVVFGSVSEEVLPPVATSPPTHASKAVSRAPSASVVSLSSEIAPDQAWSYSRNKVKTEKAHVSDDAVKDTKSPASKSRTKSHQSTMSGAKPKAKKPFTSPDAVNSEASDVDGDTKAGKTTREESPSAVSNDNANQDVSAPDSDASVPTPRKALSVAFLKAGNTSDHESAASVKAANISYRESVISLSSDSEPDTNSSLVTAREYQDSELYEIYEELPLIKRFCDVVSWSNSGTDSHDRVDYSTLRDLVSKRSLLVVRVGLNFTRSLNYVNTSRINPATLELDSGRMRLKGSNKFAVAIMLGVVTECALLDDAVVGPSHAPYTVHKVSIIPFTQEMHRDTSVWGLLYGFRRITGPITDMGISFSTRKKTDPPFSSPKKPGLFKTVQSTAVRSAASSSTSMSYSASKAFSDPVPIYDGRERDDRKAFAFTDNDFKNLSKWPLYKNGNCDLDNNAVVAVGYTLGTYLGGKNQERSLSANVQFVILLAKTV